MIGYEFIAGLCCQVLVEILLSVVKTAMFGLGLHERFVKQVSEC
jgi:hypothetical protein